MSGAGGVAWEPPALPPSRTQTHRDEFTIGFEFVAGCARPLREFKFEFAAVCKVLIEVPESPWNRFDAFQPRYELKFEADLEVGSLRREGFWIPKEVVEETNCHPTSCTVDSTTLPTVITRPCRVQRTQTQFTLGTNVTVRWV